MDTGICQVGKVRCSGEYRELKEVPSSTRYATRMMARNTAHLARLPKQAGYPPRD